MTPAPTVNLLVRDGHGDRRTIIVEQEHPVSSPTTDLKTDRLVLRSWTSADATAVVDGTRRPEWAQDFPTEGDQVIAGLVGKHPDWLGEYGHRLVIEADSGQVVGSIGLFWPP